MNKTSSTIAGALIIIGTVAGVLSVVPVIDEPDYLVQVAANENQVTLGAFFQFIMAVAYVGVAIALYPVLRKYRQGLALGFVGFRIIAGVFIIVGAISLLLVLTLSQEYVNAQAPDSAHFHTLGELLRTGRDLMNHVAMILAVSLGALMCCYIFYQTRLVPRWLSGWGLAGAALSMLASLLLMFRLIDLLTTSYMVLNLPMALQEMVLAVWLLKGFDPAASAAGAAQQTERDKMSTSNGVEAAGKGAKRFKI